MFDLLAGFIPEAYAGWYLGRRICVYFCKLTGRKRWAHIFDRLS